MEKEVKDPTAWTGSVGLILGGELYVDLSGMNDNEKAFEDGIAQLFDHINVRLRAIGAEENPSHPPVESRSPGRRSSERRDGGEAWGGGAGWREERLNPDADFPLASEELVEQNAA